MDTKWHALKLSDIERSFGTNLHDGLGRDEAKKRLETYGQNELPEGKPDSPFIIFFRQFRSPLIYVLLGASLIVLLLGEYVDSGIIAFVLIFNALVGAFQEGKAQRTLRALKEFSETQATVIRDSEEIIVLDKEVVPGDIIVLQEGEKVPADARLVETRTLRIDEAALTGESVPVHKREAVLRKPDLQAAEQTNMVFKGTNVVSGNGKAIVVATGIGTLIGKISSTIAKIDTEIPLKKNLRNLAKLIIIVIAFVSATLFGVGVFLLGMPAREMFTVVVALTVSAIPEGLPIVLTLVLATGVWRMAKRHALVKKLQAVEALGQAQVIAVDKTGTITKNELVIREVYSGGKRFYVTGAGYEPKGAVRLGENVIDAANHPDLLLAGKIAAFCASAKAIFSEEKKVWQVSGDPTEAAMAVFAEKIGFHKSDLEKECPLIYEAPFDYKTKYHATIHNLQGKEFITVAGAPEVILELSEKLLANSKSQLLTKAKRKKLETTFNGMSERGLRTVAFAFIEKQLSKDRKVIKQINLQGLTFVGFFGMEDSLRPEVPQAMERARAAGIRVVMITGDHRLTALAIAKEAGIWHEGDKIFTGHDLELLHDKALAQEIGDVTVFARVTPDHKMKIIKAYRDRGEIVAMTGDGVNDALSLVAADIGVAMGKIGTEVAKEAADIVLLDDNFGSIVSAVEEGRSLYKTIQKVVLYLFSTGLGEILVISSALFFGYPLPLLAAQIIWLNFVTDTFLDVSLAMEPEEKGLLRSRFKRPGKWIVDKLMVQRMIIMAVPMMIGTLYLFEQYFPTDLVKAQTIAITALAAFQWINAWNCRSEEKSVFEQNPFSNKYLVGATALVIFLHILALYTEPLQQILGTVPLTLKEWGIILAFALSILVAEEARKAHASIKRKYASVEA